MAILGRGWPEIRFDTGSSWDPATIESMLFADPATSGNDLVEDPGAGGVWQLLEGDDVVITSGHSDSYIYSNGDGDDVIVDSGSGSDDLLFLGLTDAQVRFRQVGDDLVAVIDADGPNGIVAGSVRMVGMGVEQIAFAADIDSAPHTVLTLAQVLASIAPASTGGSSDDSLSGSAGADTLTGHAGNDTLAGPGRVGCLCLAAWRWRRPDL